MFFLGQWTTVCNHYTWDMSVAAVVCSQLGYSGVLAAPKTSTFRVGIPRRPFLVYGFRCSGYEANITFCGKRFSEQCSINSTGVICSSASKCIMCTINIMCEYFAMNIKATLCIAITVFCRDKFELC